MAINPIESEPPRMLGTSSKNSSLGNVGLPVSKNDQEALLNKIKLQLPKLSEQVGITDAPKLEHLLDILSTKYVETKENIQTQTSRMTKRHPSSQAGPELVKSVLILISCSVAFAYNKAAIEAYHEEAESEYTDNQDVTNMQGPAKALPTAIIMHEGQAPQIFTLSKHNIFSKKSGIHIPFHHRSSRSSCTYNKIRSQNALLVCPNTYTRLEWYIKLFKKLYPNKVRST